MASAQRNFGQGPDAIVRALILIPQHPEVLAMEEPVFASDGAMEVDVTFRVNLPQDWLAAGVSPSGVRSQEVVRFHFPPTYPVDPPTPSLRQDFDRCHPHILPLVFGGRPLPCIADLSLGNLLHQQGLRGILNQTALWLDNAALGTLIDPQQGWEPARRDDLPHAFTADASALRARVTRDGGHAYLSLAFAAITKSRGTLGIIGAESITFNVDTLGQQLKIVPGDPLILGRSLALLVWPAKNADGSLFICDRYRPDDVKTFGDLLLRARDYGCERVLEEQLEWLRSCVNGRQVSDRIPVAFVLCVRRPFHMIGSTSNIELIAYAGNYSDLVSSNWRQKSVDPAAHNQLLGTELCRRLSGVEAIVGKWTLLGAGSIGSKIGIHLARQGMSPSHVVDKSRMRAHNAARHGLLPDPTHFQEILASQKVALLCESLAAFGQPVEPVNGDAVSLLSTKVERRRIISKSTTTLVNSCASIRVRETLSALTPEELPARVVETSLFADGRVGLVTVEGAGRTPNTGDLITNFYHVVGKTPLLREHLFKTGQDLTRVSIGEGCGSSTMVLADSCISAHAAAMAQMVSGELLKNTNGRVGRIAIGHLGKDDLSLNWTHHVTPPVKVIPVSRPSGWTVRLSGDVEAYLLAEIARHPVVETGGILLGRLSEIARTFYVVDVLPAPPDSRRSATLFELGTKGVRAALREYSERHGWSLYCLGTWHSHLGSSEPSVVDALTARAIALARVTPSLLLIKAPGGYSALVADAAKPL